MKSNEYDINKALKPPKSFFTWCESQIPTYVWKNKSKMITSNRSDCEVIEVRLSTQSKLNFWHGSFSFNIVLVTTKKIEIQHYVYSSRFICGLQSIEGGLKFIESWSRGKHECVREEYYSKKFYRSQRASHNTLDFYGSFFPNDWEKKVQQLSELKYLTFTKPLQVSQLGHIYKYRSEIEFLQKINANKLSSEIMYPGYIHRGHSVIKNIDYRIVTRRFLAKNKNFFKNSNHSFNEFEMEKRIKARNGKFVPGIEEYLNYKDIANIPNGVGLISFQNWMIKHKVNFRYYLDYLNVLKDLNVTVDFDNNLVMPKDLTVAHDNAVKLLNQMKREIEEKKFKNRVKSTLKYEKTIGKYKFVVPKSAYELIVEGKTLHHCVGSSSYIDRHANQTTTIIFIRDVLNPDQPLYTLEYNNKRIIQCRGKHNCSAPEDVQKAISKWLKITSRKKLERKEGHHYV